MWKAHLSGLELHAPLSIPTADLFHCKKFLPHTVDMCLSKKIPKNECFVIFPRYSIATCSLGSSSTNCGISKNKTLLQLVRALSFTRDLHLTSQAVLQPLQKHFERLSAFSWGILPSFSSLPNCSLCRLLRLAFCQNLKESNLQHPWAVISNDQKHSDWDYFQNKAVRWRESSRLLH